ncbi:hypothetical protein BGZ70_004894, partial [Mortierella alpina]
MRKSLSLLALVGLLAVGSAAPVCDVLAVYDQDVFGHPKLRTKSHGDGAVVYLPPSRNLVMADLDGKMNDLIRKEMKISYNKDAYMKALASSVCSGHKNGLYFKVNPCYTIILDDPVIKVIPTKQVSKDIVCSTGTCTIILEETVTVSTTHSTEVSLSMEAGAKPFGIGVTFTATAGYGYSSAAETSTALSYSFGLVR